MQRRCCAGTCSALTQHCSYAQLEVRAASRWPSAGNDFLDRGRRIMRCSERCDGPELQGDPGICKGYEVLCAQGSASMDLAAPEGFAPRSDYLRPADAEHRMAIEFLSVIRRRFPQLPVIVISGAVHGLRRAAQRCMAEAFFEKSQYTPDCLMATASPPWCGMLRPLARGESRRLR